MSSHCDVYIFILVYSWIVVLLNFCQILGLNLTMLTFFTRAIYLAIGAIYLTSQLKIPKFAIY
jgi:hypothetical protein